MTSVRSTPPSQAAPGQAEEPPFPGPRPFTAEESNRFFGRTDEAADLASLVRSHAAMLLFADSGAGKSSLIEAGLRPRLEDRLDAFVLSGRVRGPSIPDCGPSGNVYVENLLRSLDPDRQQEPSGQGGLPLRLADGLNAVPWGDAGLRVVVVDQMEEVFTLFPERWSERRSFFEQIQEAIDGDPLLRFLLSMRSDYLTRMHPYTSAFSDDLRTRYQLERLRRNDALDAVIRPSRETSRRFSPEAADVLVGNLLAIPSEVPGAPAVPGEFVDPGELQIVSRDLWQQVPPGEITSEQVLRLARLDEVHRRFYERTITETVAASRVDERDLRTWFGTSLITPGKTRGFLFRDTKKTGGLPNSVVDVLEQQQIIRAEHRTRARWYELTHDRLVPAVLESNEHWSRRRADVRRRRVVGAAAFVVVAILCVVGVVAGGTSDSPSGTPRLADLFFEGGQGRGVDQIRFTARKGSALLAFELDHFEDSTTWKLRLYYGREMIADPQVDSVDGYGGVLLRSLPYDGVYELEVGHEGLAYSVTGTEAVLAPALVSGCAEVDVRADDTVSLHEITADSITLVTVSNARASVRLLDTNGAYHGSPDFEDEDRSQTVMVAGEYLLEVALDEPASYSVCIQAPAVQPLVDGQRADASIGDVGELDFYSFNTSDGRVALFRMTSAAIHSQLTILGPQGFDVSSMPLAADPALSSSFVAFAGEKPGDHVLIARAARPEEMEADVEPRALVGSYGLSYRISDLPP